MEPEIREGDIIFVDTKKEPSEDNIILYHNAQKFKLRRFHQESQPGNDDEGYLYYGTVIGINRKMA